MTVQSIARPGQTISSTNYERRVGGKGANQAVALARAGGTVDLSGAVGEDGLWVIEHLASFGVNVGGVEVVKVCCLFARLVAEHLNQLCSGTHW